MLRLFIWFVDNARAMSRKRYIYLAILIALTGIVELIALSGLAVFITSLTALDQVLESRYVVYVKELVGMALFDNTSLFYFSLGAWAIFFIFLKNVMTALHVYISARIEGALNVDYGSRMLDGVMRLPYQQATGVNTAERIEVVAWRACVGTLSSGMMTIFSELIVFSLLISSLLVLDPALALAMISVLGIIGVLSFWGLKGRVLALNWLSMSHRIAAYKSIVTGVQGVREVQLFGVESEVLKSFKLAQEGDARCQAQSRLFERGTVWILETVGMGGVVVGALVMIFCSDDSVARTMGMLSMLAIAAWRILPSMYRIASVFGTINSQLPYLHSVKKLVEEVDAWQRQCEDFAPAVVQSLVDRLELRGVGFKYDNADVVTLSDVSFTVKRGSCVGVVGESGAGKSTLADILSGLLEPSQGQIEIDGILLDGASLSSWRRRVGFVSQKPYLIDGTIAENVAFSMNRDDVDCKKVERCCELAGVFEFLNKSALGINTPIGEQGSLLSGGQAQRVAIARALYRDPELLIFDEATSSLDDRNEKTIHDTILNLRGKVTIIIIAHKLSAVKDCDFVIWMKDGFVHEIGEPSVVLSKYAQAGSAEFLDNEEAL